MQLMINHILNLLKEQAKCCRCDCASNQPQKDLTARLFEELRVMGMETPREAQTIVEIGRTMERSAPPLSSWMLEMLTRERDTNA